VVEQLTADQQVIGSNPMVDFTPLRNIILACILGHIKLAHAIAVLCLLSYCFHIKLAHAIAVLCLLSYCFNRATACTGHGSRQQAATLAGTYQSSIPSKFAVSHGRQWQLQGLTWPLRCFTVPTEVCTGGELAKALDNLMHGVLAFEAVGL